MSNEKRIEEIKARAEAAEAPYVDDVPFLLEQLKTWRMTSAVFEKAAESAQAKLAASEAAAGQMRAALGKTLPWLDRHTLEHEDSTRSQVEAALAADAGKGWVSPNQHFDQVAKAAQGGWDWLRHGRR